MSEYCEICKTQKNYQVASLQLTLITGLKHAWLYACNCPVYMLDELNYLQRHKITLSDNEIEGLKSLARQKKDYAIKFKFYDKYFDDTKKQTVISYDNFNSRFNKTKAMDENAKNEKGIFIICLNQFK